MAQTMSFPHKQTIHWHMMTAIYILATGMSGEAL
jgi:hypothetical protein